MKYKTDCSNLETLWPEALFEILTFGLIPQFETLLFKNIDPVLKPNFETITPFFKP